MYKSLIGALVLPLLMLTATAGNAAASSLTVYNGTDYTVTSIEASIGGVEPDWEDVMGGEPLSSGDQVIIKSPEGAEACYFDILVIYDDGYADALQAQNFCNDGEVHLQRLAATEEENEELEPVSESEEASDSAPASALTVNNYKDADLVGLQLSAVGANEWGDNLLSEPVEYTKSVVVDAANDAGECVFDVRATWQDGIKVTESSIDFCAGGTLDLAEYDEGANYCTLEDVAAGKSCAHELATLCEDYPEVVEISCDEFWKVYTKP